MRRKAAERPKIVVFERPATGIPLDETVIPEQSRLEELAKTTYLILAHRTSRPEAWEQITEVERMAWREAVDFLTSCPDCGSRMVCPQRPRGIV